MGSINFLSKEDDLFIFFNNKELIGWGIFTGVHLVSKPLATRGFLCSPFRFFMFADFSDEMMCDNKKREHQEGFSSRSGIEKQRDYPIHHNASLS